MPRFFLHVENSTGYIPDEEGEDLPSVEAARTMAVKSVRSILADEVRQGRIDLRGRIHVADESGAILFILPYGDAAELFLGPPPGGGESEAES